ncbi:MAG: carboxypeptidase-like regulatory domain-containing protein [Crocinitomicaceae bacterium]|nr:carboxypeptidase-like regulatory domain-containing protein [Crocinitomicaceae bacterium]
MKKLIVIMTLLVSVQSFAQVAFGEVVGEVVKNGTMIPVVDATVWIDDNGKKYRVKTDFDGRFRISAIPAGLYRLNVLSFGDTLKDVFVDVPMDDIYDLGLLQFGPREQQVDGVTVSADRVRIIGGFLPVPKLDYKEIDKSPAKFDVKALVSSMTSEVRQTEDGELVFRGARKGDMIYMIDGVKTRDAGSMPGVSIGRMMIYTGGLPAKYGDTLGGVVVIESKSYFDLYRTWEGEQIRKGLM